MALEGLSVSQIAPHRQVQWAKALPLAADGVATGTVLGQCLLKHRQEAFLVF